MATDFYLLVLPSLRSPKDCTTRQIGGIKNFIDIIYFIYLFKTNKKKLFSFLKCLFLNYFVVPRYFKSFYLEYVKLNFNPNDDIVFQSCRRKDIALIYFLYNIDIIQLPKIHIRIFHLPKKRFKDFYFYFDKIMEGTKKNVFLYTEMGKKKKILTSKLGSKSLINVTKPIFSFYNRRLDLTNHTIGFIGEARTNKGFNEIPKFIQIIKKYDKDVNFIREGFPVASTEAKPLYYAQFDGDAIAAGTHGHFIVGPTPDANYVVELHYYYEPPSIVSTATSWLGDNADSVLLYGSLVEAYTFMKGEADIMKDYKERYEASLKQLSTIDAFSKRDSYRDGEPR